MESTVITTETRSDYISKLYKFLVLLSNCDMTNSEERERRIYLANEVLYAIFKIETNQIKLFESETKKIGPLIMKSLWDIEMCVDNEIFNFVESSIYSTCVLRSGVQFIIDNYTNYFDNEEFDLETIAKTIKEFERNLCMRYLDEKLKSYTNSDYDDPDMYAEIKEKFEQIDSKNHPWWCDRLRRK